MPFKNTEPFIGDCIASIRAQEYEHWELVAVNDHSSDASAGILDSLARRDPRIRVLGNPGLGIIPALRYGYAHCQGTLITRMDSDDLMHPARLGRMVADLSDRGPGHIALGQVRYFSDRGISDGYARYERWLNGLTEEGSNFRELYKECVIPSPCWMVFRSDLEACGGFQPDRYPEDYDLCFRFYKNGLSCIPSSQLLHYWRDYDTRTSRTSEHYAQNYFLELKTHYFLELHHDPTRPLFVWGAGTKGKKVARLLLEAKTPFHWVCDNPKKIGKRIYGQVMKNFREIRSYGHAQSIVTVANTNAQAEIREFMETLDAAPMQDYFFFC